MTPNDLPITADQCRGARGLLNLSQSQVARSAHVAQSTIADFERSARIPTYNNLLAIRTALQSAGVAFIAANGGGPGARLHKGPNVEGAKDAAISPDRYRTGRPGLEEGGAEFIPAHGGTVAAISPEQCRAARAVLKLSQTELARAAGLGRSTLADYERATRTPTSENLAAIRVALEGAGIAFIDPDGGGPGVRLRA